MLGSYEAVATVAVRDAEAASRFYGDVLGLEPLESAEPGVLVYRTGASTLLVYESEYAGTNQATTVTWSVGERLDEIVRTLAARGVVFERYDMPGLTLEGDIHVAGSVRLAWFKDPDGAIHHLYGG